MFPIPAVALYANVQVLENEGFDSKNCVYRAGGQNGTQINNVAFSVTLRDQCSQIIKMGNTQ